jgi:7-keto-8-aminopelargonate synthetase-like enzyme
MNFARSVIYTTAPSFPTVAGIRAAYKLMADGETQKVPMTPHHFFKPESADSVRSSVPRQYPTSGQALFQVC